MPPPLPIALLMLDAALCLIALAALSGRPTLAFVLATLLISGAAIGLTLARVWAVALLPWLTAALLLVLLYARRAAALGLLSKLLGRYARGAALNYGLAKYLLVSEPGTPAFAEELGKMTALSFPVIALPSTLVLVAALFYLLQGVQKLTHLQLDDIFQEV